MSEKNSHKFEQQRKCRQKTDNQRKNHRENSSTHAASKETKQCKDQNCGFWGFSEIDFRHHKSCLAAPFKINSPIDGMDVAMGTKFKAENKNCVITLMVRQSVDRFTIIYKINASLPIRFSILDDWFGYFH